MSMKRKIVQHGPSTLTISLPAKWAKESGVGKGDELTLEQVGQGLLVTSTCGVRLQEKHVNLQNVSPQTTERIVAALYKRGYDAVMLEYDTSAQLEAIYGALGKGCIGFEVLDDKKGEVHIRSVSEPSTEEFKALFRRVFYFLLSVADESVEAAKAKDTSSYRKLILRDESINKLCDFCRRMINKRGQREYGCDTVLYHIVEQLEKIADEYKGITSHLLTANHSASPQFLTQYAAVAKLTHSYEELFFRFSMERVDAFTQECLYFINKVSAIQGEEELFHRLRRIAVELHNLTGSTMALHL